MSVLGLSKAQANWAFKISKKHAIWIGNTIKENPKLYPKGKNLFKKIMAWKKKNPAINLKQYKYKNLLRLVLDNGKTTFFKDEGSLKNDRIVAICEGSQFKWVELITEDDCVEEGEYMSHCLEDSSHNYIGNGELLFSLRDLYNKPVVTLQLVQHDYGTDYYIEEYRASHDDDPEKKYAKFFSFLEVYLKKKRIKVSGISKYENDITSKLSKKDLTFKGDLEITDDNSMLVCDGLTVKGSLIFNTVDMDLPRNLSVGGDLTLGEECEVLSIPKGTKIGGDLEVYTAYLEQLDFRNIKLGGKVFFNT
jgi:hypothetical protein